jgi:hypothetical protein
MKHAIIGDVHGRWIQLRKILSDLGINKSVTGWTNKNDYKIVQLGDLNDWGKDGEYSSLYCLEMMMELTELGIAEVVHSNHQDKLQRYLNGNKVTPSHGLDRTIEEIKETSMDFQGQLYTWLSKRPLYYEFIEDKQMYICVHAYIDDRMLYMFDKDPHWDETSKGRDYVKSQCIYGITNKEGRLKWFEEDCTDRFKSFHLICGHYHVEKHEKNYTMLDNEEELVCWIPSENRQLRELK